MKIGIDFDNTIVRYDEAFHKAAAERDLLRTGVAATKEAVKRHLQLTDREEDWIALQGFVYGPGIAAARLFEGVTGFVDRARSQGHEVFVISHKTRHPFRGPQYDLHQHARSWLEESGFLAGAMAAGHVFFELTKESKLGRVAELGCDWFIDDLPAILAHEQFPACARGVLFDPGDAHPEEERWPRVRDWAAAADLILEGKGGA